MYLIKTKTRTNFLKKISIKISSCRNGYKKLENQLALCDDSIPYFTLAGNVYQGKITSISNQFEFNLCINYNNKITKFACRLYGIKNDNEKYQSTLNSLLPDNKLVYVVANNFDSDGRLLVTLYLNEYLSNIGDMSINEQFIIKNNIENQINNLEPFFEINI